MEQMSLTSLQSAAHLRAGNDEVVSAVFIR